MGAHALLVMGMCAAERGELTVARQCVEQSLARWARSDSWGAAWALIELARLALRDGDDDQAAVRLAQSLALSRDLGDPWSTAAGIDVRAALAARTRHPDRAVRLGEAANGGRGLAHIVQSPRERAWLRLQLSALEHSLPRNRHVAERQAGRAMTLDQIFELALDRERDDRPAAPTLTLRERDVARLLARGLE